MGRSLPVTIGAVVLALGCSHASSGPGRTTGDAAAPDATSCSAEDDCIDATADAPAPDTGWACPVIPESNVGADCDACIQKSCDAQWCACEGDTTLVEAGTPECLAYLTCLEDCPDGGDAGGCPGGGCAAVASSPTSQQKGQALLMCIVQSCATACPGAVDLLL
jgi:hypothetical protein